MRIFLSSTREDLREYRDKASDAIERLGQDGARMEVFGARPDQAEQASCQEIESCDALIGIYAHRYGFTPAGTSVSITEQEFDFALKTNKPVFGFLLDPSYPWRPDQIEPEPGSSRLRRFKSKIESSVVREIFTTPDDLAYKVASSLGHFIIRKGISDELDRTSQSLLSQQGRDQVARRASRLKLVLEGARALLVNDVPSEMSSVTKILTSLGVFVHISTTSNEGLEALANQTFDLVISDMMRDNVPDEGIRFLTQMRNLNLRRPTIFTVGSFKPEMGVPAYAFGITNRVDEMLNLVFDALERVRG